MLTREGFQKKVNALEGTEFYPKEAKAVVSINPKIYPLEVIYAAAYVLLDKAYFILDGDPEKSIKITIMAKNEKAAKKELEKIALQLHDELINYATYIVQAARNQAVREAIIKRALATNNETEETVAAVSEYAPESTETLLEKAGEISMAKEPSQDEDLFINDPEGIAKPWTPEKAKGLKKPDCDGC